MISAKQAAAFRETATREIEQGFPTAIVFDDDETQTPVACARWSLVTGMNPELAGLMPTGDVAFRIRLASIPAGVKIVDQKTRLKEDGIPFRVEHHRTGKNDPSIVLECKNV